MLFVPTLHLRNVPVDVYEALRARAAQNGQSINATVVEILEEDVQQRRADAEMRRRLQEIAGRITLPADAPPPEDLIREDRDSR